MCVCVWNSQQKGKTRKWGLLFIGRIKGGKGVVSLTERLTVLVLFAFRTSTERHKNDMTIFYEIFLNYESNEWSHDYI